MPRGKSRTRHLLRWVVIAALAVLVAISGSVARHVLAPPHAVAQETLDDPVVYKMQGFYDRIDDDVDELRADFVLKVPHGFINPQTGAAQPVRGVHLRIGHDFGNGSVRNSRYQNTLDGKTGADRWANNRDEYFTVHSVITSGKYDYLVISVEGDLDIPTNSVANNVVGGKETPMNWYFSYASGNPPNTNTSTSWINSSRTIQTVHYYAYYGYRSNGVAITGPQFRVQWDGTYSLWSGDQANWGQVLDFGLNASPPGVLPPNSVAIDLVNNATRAGSRVEEGYAGTVSESFWYAWVHEDGSLVSTINTAPIHITGVTPSNSWITSTAQVSKNISQPGVSWSLGWTPEQGAQGLTNRVGADGSIDFTDAGGTGYYRLLAWPESRDPLTPAGDNGAPVISYTAADLFDGNGYLTARADAEKWIPGTVYYGYDIPLPVVPHITTPPAGWHTNQAGVIEITGTGTPGHTISLKLAPGTGIVDFNDPALTVLVDGDHEGVLADDVLVDAAGNWSYTYTPDPIFADGTYTVVATQTDQDPGGFHLTSPMSNPNDEAAPTAWGVHFTVDTIAPAAPGADCPASPTEETQPRFSGTGVEAGATVRVLRDGEEIADAVIDGESWSYVPEPPLHNGNYRFSFLQIDAAGNVSGVSDPVCELRVATAVHAHGEKTVAGVAHGNPELVDPAPDNWEVTLADGEDTVVMSGDESVLLTRDRLYTVGERLRADPDPDPAAAAYARLGQLSCVDADGGDLPGGVLDPEASSLLVGSDVDLAEPITCTITNQAAHASFLVQRLGGQTEQPSAGWGLNLAYPEGGPAAGTEVALTADTASAIVRPADVQLTASVPDGLSLIGVQRLDPDRPECAAYAGGATPAPKDCWVSLTGDAPWTGSLPQGSHSVFRIIAGAPADLPALPVTGGLGSWIFTAGGAGVLALAGGAYLRRRYLISAAAKQEGRGQ